MLFDAYQRIRRFLRCARPRAAAAWFLGLAAAAAVTVTSTAPARAQPAWRWPPAERIVVVADVHGAYPALVQLLEATGVIDAQLKWTAGDATLVSLGDLLDRGAESRKVLDLLMRLQRDAAERGGAVHVVLGNHEAMNLSGDLRYVSTQEYAAFAVDEPPGARSAALAQFLATQPEGVAEADARLAFERRFPAGYFGHRAAFAADGTYGRWLLERPALLVVGDTAFVHGGLSALVAREGGAALNGLVSDGLRRSVAAAAEVAEPALGPQGPLWYRGSVYCNEFLEEPVLDAALRALGAARVIVGHTPSADRRVRSLYDGRLIMLDTGMLADYYAGRPAALVIEDGQFVAQYLAPGERLPLERGRIEAAGLTRTELEAALAAGAIAAASTLGGAQAGVAPVVVRHDGREIPALYYSAERAPAELAAYALDRLLGLALVPPTVARERDGVAGALQLAYPGAVTEAERVQNNVALGEWCALEPQLQLMYVFDALTSNVGRARDNVLFVPEPPLLKLRDHARAFGAERRVRLADDALAITPELRAALEKLDRESLEVALGSWLDAAQIRALLARRDALLEAGRPD